MEIVKRMEDLKLGNLIMTKKGLAILIFAVFLSGIICGGMFFINAIDSPSSSTQILFLFSIVFLWFFTFLKLGKYVKNSK
jgi:hypothetical protein